MVGSSRRSRRHRRNRSLQLEILTNREVLAAVPLVDLVPSVDLDTDSDNNGVIERSAEEDRLEWRSPGKVVRLNIDDDNGNGSPDHADWPFRDGDGNFMNDDDLVEAVVSINAESEDLSGYTLRLTPTQGASDAPLHLWATRYKLPLQETYVIGQDELPARIYVEGVPGSISGAALAILEDPQGNSVSEDLVAFAVLDPFILAYRPQTEGPGYGHPLARTPVPRDWSLPVGIRRNTDDDDQNGLADATQTNVAHENDLIEIQLNDLPQFSGQAAFRYHLEAPAAALKVWTTPDKGQLMGGPLAAIPRSLWVEWVHPTSNVPATLTASVVDINSGNVALTSTMSFAPFQSTVIVFTGEFQEPSDPVQIPGNQGMIQFAIDEYRNGYDVHLYDEDDLAHFAMGGAPFLEAVNAVNLRGVTDVAIMGYSHGGGSTYLLAKYLDETTRLVRPYRLVFTSYIDGVGQPFANPLAERRRPIASRFHVNQYERTSTLHGGPTAGDDDIDRTNLGVTHSTIDDHADVLGLLRQRFEQKTQR